ncbi:MAG TPA: polysaccharide deacetylase family protein [bacterium]|nr:polysaccharide deacetylase family protein [bacterium]
MTRPFSILALGIISVFISFNTTGCANQTDIATMPVEPSTPAAPAFSIPESLLAFDATIPVLLFHYIEPAENTAPGNALAITPEQLESYLSYFHNKQIETITFRDLKQIIEGNRSLPERAVILTFDDGYANQYQYAFPLLERYAMRGVFFIITEKPDADPAYMTWEQIKTLSDAGHEIGSHSVAHPDLTALQPDRLEEELATSRSSIERIIGLPVLTFCYPSGQYNDQVLAAVRDQYLFARSTQPGSNIALDRRYEMPALRVTATVPAFSLGELFTK